MCRSKMKYISQIFTENVLMLEFSPIVKGAAAGSILLGIALGTLEIKLKNHIRYKRSHEKICNKYEGEQRRKCMISVKTRELAICKEIVKEADRKFNNRSIDNKTRSQAYKIKIRYSNHINRLKKDLSKNYGINSVGYMDKDKNNNVKSEVIKTDDYKLFV